MDEGQLLIVSDHRIFRECLVALLEDDRRFARLAQWENLDEAMPMLRAAGADLLLLDLASTRRPVAQAVRDVLRLGPETRVIVLGTSGDEAEIEGCIEAGATGYIPKDYSLEALREAIDSVLSGNAFCPPRITLRLFTRLAELALEQRRSEQAEALILTAREMEVLQQVARGASNRQIADRLFLSVYTVKNHVHNILRKLRVADRHEAVQLAYKKGWLRDQSFSADEK